MKQLVFVLLVSTCLFLVGFSMRDGEIEIYLQNDESVFITRSCDTMTIWLYTFNTFTRNWEYKKVDTLETNQTKVVVHYSEVYLQPTN